MLIIIVDPYREDLTNLKEMLHSLYPTDTVAAFANPLEAIKFAHYNPPDFLFTNREIDTLDGFELIKIFRQWYPGIKCVLLGGDKRLRSRIEAGEADAYIDKAEYYFNDEWKAIIKEIMARDSPKERDTQTNTDS